MYKNNKHRNVSALIDGVLIEEADIINMELSRAHHALNFLKSKIDPNMMHSIMARELLETTNKSEKWVSESEGKWQSNSVLLTVDGLSADDFHLYFMGLIKNNNEPEIRAAHPDHYRNRILSGGPEIIENIGEDNYPWHVFGRFISVSDIPAFEQEKSFDISFGLEVKSVNDNVIAYAGHELRNFKSGMQAKLTIVLPYLAEKTLVRGHLNHFAVEFRNWCLSAPSSTDI
ncbi:hypothetical protein [Aeromonas sp. A35_P]|uniref:hypothetical protein n=1 Tax=Aeromonas sp. A35_P TaxID=1983805 RepID=UPI001140582A|nr:hypothetical protein [Aeromonas sp. A35_P]